jgi:hypothetical protein
MSKFMNIFMNMHNKFEAGQVVSCSDPFLRKYTHSMEPCVGVIEEVTKKEVIVDCGTRLGDYIDPKIMVRDPRLLKIIDDKDLADKYRKEIWR